MIKIYILKFFKNKLKKVVPIVIGLFFIFYILFFKKNSCQNKRAINYSLEGKNFCLLVANSPYEHQKGLMNVEKPVNFDGMIFIFSDKQIRSFWNMNTYLDLDLYWLDGDEVVGKDYLPSITKSKKVISISSKRPVNKVVEIIK